MKIKEIIDYCKSRKDLNFKIKYDNSVEIEDEMFDSYFDFFFMIQDYASFFPKIHYSKTSTKYYTASFDEYEGKFQKGADYEYDKSTNEIFGLTKEDLVNFCNIFAEEMKKTKEHQKLLKMEKDFNDD